MKKEVSTVEWLDGLIDQIAEQEEFDNDDLRTIAALIQAQALFQLAFQHCEEEDDPPHKTKSVEKARKVLHLVRGNP